MIAINRSSILMTVLFAIRNTLGFNPPAHEHLIDAQ
jgi:hypothetical protein